jgi:hypothetical protein
LPDGAAAPVSSASTLGGSLAFLNGFEGEIDGFVKEAKDGNRSFPVAVELKSGRARFQLPDQLTKGGPMMLGEKPYAIFDGTAKKVMLVNDTQKQAMVLDLNSAGKTLSAMPRAPGATPSGSPSSPPKVIKTGKFETIAGYKCENWDVSSDHREGTVCVASEGASWLSIPLGALPSERAWMLELADGKHFPLRFIGYAKDGATEETRVEITKVDKRSLPDSDFQLPAGYRTIDLDNMLRSMGGAPAGMPSIPLPIPHRR